MTKRRRTRFCGSVESWSVPVSALDCVPPVAQREPVSAQRPGFGCTCFCEHLRRNRYATFAGCHAKPLADKAFYPQKQVRWPAATRPGARRTTSCRPGFSDESSDSSRGLKARSTWSNAPMRKPPKGSAQKRVRMKTGVTLSKRVLAFKQSTGIKRSMEMADALSHADSGTHAHAATALAYAETGSL